jgi:hypothetical protein
MVNENFKKYLAEIVTEDTGIDTPVDRILDVQIRDGLYVVKVKNSWLEEGYETEFVSQHQLLVHIINKLESNC